MRPLVSIIIPTYNRCHLIGETLDSIISQTFQNWECIVIDDDSNDYTRELLEFYCEKDNRFRFFIRPESLNKGANSCRNYGLSQTNGKYINWFDSDDLMDCKYIEKQCYLIASEKTDCSISDYSVFHKNPEGSFYRVYNKSNNSDFLFDYTSGEINPGIHGTLWKKEALVNIAFDETLKWAQELDFFFRLFKSHSLKISFLSENLIFLRRHEDSLTGNYNNFKIQETTSELRVRRSILEYLYSIESRDKELKKALQIYFRGFLRLFYSRKWNIVSDELNQLMEIFDLNSGVLNWKIKLRFLHVLKNRWKGIKVQSHLQKFYFLINYR